MSEVTVNYFIRKFGSALFSESKKSIFDLDTIPVKTDAVARTIKAFCTVHKKWEEACVYEDMVKTECGFCLHGIPVEIAGLPTDNDRNWTYFREKENSIEKETRLDRDKRIVKYCEYLNMENSIKIAQNKIRNYLDEKECSKDIISFTLVTNEKKHSLALTFQTLDRNITDSYLFNPTKPLPLKNNTIQGTIENGVIIRTANTYFNVELPELAKEQLHSFVNSYAGKNISFNTCVHGEQLLDGVCSYPYEPNVISIEGCRKSRISLSSEEKKDSNVYNIVCDKLGIKSYRSLRKSFYTNPLCLVLVSKLKDFSFTDTNIINEILADKASVQFLELPEMHQRFFTQWLIKERGERPAWNILKKADWKTREYTDALMMFNTYHAMITPDMKESISKEGLTPYHHDILSKMATDCKTRNVVFSYSYEQTRLEDSIDEYDFMLPVDSNELREIGSRLHNCVASYKSRVLRGECIIVFAKKDEQYKLCIEVRGKHIWQQRADRNAAPIGEDLTALLKWEHKHSLGSIGS